MDEIPLTVPRLASTVGLTLHELTSMLARRPDLAGRLVRVGGRRLVMPADLPAFREAVADRERACKVVRA